MSTIFFVIPAHGRLEVSQVCLRQLAATCETLNGGGFATGVVVVAEDANLDIARSLGFEVLKRPNRPLGQKWNDGIEAACRLGADYVVRFGSDDWIDPVYFAELPGDEEIRACRESSVIREDGLRLARLHIHYHGGDGVQTMPRALLERVQFRPADDHRDRAIDTSIMQRFARANNGSQPHIRYADAHPFQIVDWKTAGGQLNTYQACLAFLDGEELDPWETLEGRYPDSALDDMRAIYRLPERVAA